MSSAVDETGKDSTLGLIAEQGGAEGAALYGGDALKRPASISEVQRVVQTVLTLEPKFVGCSECCATCPACDER
jgi:hypothetical protein